MEKKVVRIFYLGIAQGECYAGGRRQRKEGLPVRIADCRPEFPGGYLEIAYALLPEYAGKKLFTGCGKKWKEKVKQSILQKTMEHVERMPEHREIVSAQELPREVVAAHLHSFAPFERVCVIFSREGGTFEAREAILLLAPYLRRMRQVILVGEDNGATELFSDYLYYEYGLVPDRYARIPGRSDRAKEKLIRLDMSGRMVTEGEDWKPLGASECINREETLKFLDTAVKNGYNTES